MIRSAIGIVLALTLVGCVHVTRGDKHHPFKDHDPDAGPCLRERGDGCKEQLRRLEECIGHLKGHMKEHEHVFSRELKNVQEHSHKTASRLEQAEKKITVHFKEVGGAIKKLASPVKHLGARIPLAGRPGVGPGHAPDGHEVFGLLIEHMKRVDVTLKELHELLRK